MPQVKATPEQVTQAQIDVQWVDDTFYDGEGTREQLVEILPVSVNLISNIRNVYPDKKYRKDDYRWPSAATCRKIRERVEELDKPLEPNTPLESVLEEAPDITNNSALDHLAVAGKMFRRGLDALEKARENAAPFAQHGIDHLYKEIDGRLKHYGL